MEIVDFEDLIPRDSDLAHRCRQLQEKSFSDIIDDGGHQYVDLVMEGGGMLGIALCGYTHALEQSGIRFRSIGGTSAGALTALLLATLGKPCEAKSLEVAKALASMPADKFIDSDAWTNFWVRKFLRGRLGLIFLIALTFPRIVSSFGLIKGQRFQEWLSDTLSEKLDIEDSTALLRHLADADSRPKGLEDIVAQTDSAYSRQDWPTFDPVTGFERELAIVVADVSTERKVVFPKDTSRYFEDSEHICAAHFVRASISIPLFFYPVRRCISDAMKQNWEPELRDKLPEYVQLVDGGLISNFPISLFHCRDNDNVPDVPRMPTFGARLGLQRVSRIDTITQFLKGVVVTVISAGDDEFIRRNQEYEQLVGRIPVHGIDGFNIFMKPEEKKEMFRRGFKSGVEFLEGFSWNRYKRLRIQLYETFSNDVQNNRASHVT